MKRALSKDFESDSEFSENSQRNDEAVSKKFGNLEKRVKREFEKTRRCVEASQPNINTILSLEISQDVKNELFELYEIYESMDDLTLEKMELKKRINETIKKAKNAFKDEERIGRFEKEFTTIQPINKLDILNLPTSVKNRQVILREFTRSQTLSPSDEELPKIQRWLQWAFALPYDRILDSKTSDISTILCQVKKELDKELYGLQSVKEQLLIFLNARIHNPGMKKCNLGLIGPPGCGKTSIARLLSKILHFPFQQISLGGIKNADFLKGHSYTYIGSEPGEIVKALSRMSGKNGILFLDEFDKVSDEVISVLLHITDPSQNETFHDNYLSGIDIDLSCLWQIYSMNSQVQNTALSDRIHYIHIPEYTIEEKRQIVKYILKKGCKNIGLKEDDIQFENDVIERIVDSYLSVRKIEHAVNEICNKLFFVGCNGKKVGMSFDIGKVTFPVVLDLKRLERIGM